MDTKAIVFGATGKTGIEICKQLSNSGINHSAFVRESSTGKITEKETIIINGDVLNPNDLKMLFKNEEFTDVIIALGSKSLKGSEVRSKGTENIIEAMKNNQSSAKIHVISALGVGESWIQLKWSAKLLTNILLKNVIADHLKQEEIVVKNAKTYHIIRPVGLTDKEATGKVHVQNEGFLPSGQISRADVAKFLVDTLNNTENEVDSICEVK